MSRNGAMVSPAKLSIRGRLQFIGSSADAEITRVIVFQLSYQTAAFVPSQLLESLLGALSYMAPYNEAYVGQSDNDSTIEILYDKAFSSHFFDTQSIPLHIEIDSSAMAVRKLRYESPLTNEPLKGAIGIAFYASNNSPAVDSEFWSRLYFSDC